MKFLDYIMSIDDYDILIEWVVPNQRFDIFYKGNYIYHFKKDVDIFDFMEMLSKRTSEIYELNTSTDYIELVKEFTKVINLNYYLRSKKLERILK